MHPIRTGGAILLLALVAGCGCARAQDRAPADDIAALVATLDRLDEHARRVEEILLPVRLLRSAEESSLNRYPNSRHVAVARRLGIPPRESEDAVMALVRTGRLVRLPDSTATWVIRRLDHSLPYVTPDVPVFLEALGERFQRELEALGLPRFRLEVSSVLRTAASQADLRTTNENAASGRSSHEYGTTVDVAYDGFAAPADLPTGLGDDLPEALVREMFRLALERVAARKSRELEALLGRVLIQMQEEGAVLVLLEQLQPVFHLTVARRG